MILVYKFVTAGITNIISRTILESNLQLDLFMSILQYSRTIIIMELDLQLEEDSRMVSGLVREPENMNRVGYAGGFVYNPSPNNGPILPDVAFGPRRGYVETNQRNLRKSQGSEMENTRNPISQDELSVLLSGLNISKEEDDVPDDDKTVFLTFSKGYPITESELWGYFTSCNLQGMKNENNHLKEVQEKSLWSSRDRFSPKGGSRKVIDRAATISSQIH